jgi:hypothetical protein
VDLAVRGFAVLGVAALRLMDFLDVFRFAMSPPGVWLVVRVCGSDGDPSALNGLRREGISERRIFGMLDLDNQYFADVIKSLRPAGSSPGWVSAKVR